MGIAGAITAAVQVCRADRAACASVVDPKLFSRMQRSISTLSYRIAPVGSLTKRGPRPDHRQFCKVLQVQFS
jgi:hypothetical protein